MAEVLLVQMPYAAVERPSLALGVLKASLDRARISSAVAYPNLDFADEIGLETYQAVNSYPFNSLLGEWTFGKAAFPGFETDPWDFLDLPLVRGEIEVGGLKNDWLLEQAAPGETVQDVLIGLREKAVAFVDRAAERVLEAKPAIVGCTSTFQQHCAALALLRKVKELDPAVLTILGGANCEGPMGAAAHRNFRWIDFLVSGEADLLFPVLVRRVLEHGGEVPLAELPYGTLGPASRNPAGESSEAPRVVIHQMDEVPVPDFADYFEALGASALAAYVQPGLPVEMARGCWWGAKSHCTFCGLNGSGMGFRSKSPGRVLAELDTLSERHGITDIDVVDNILDMGYFRTVLPELAAAEKDYFAFYETKSNLKKEHFELLAAAGITYIQPGIESLHQGPLDLIGKGCTPMTNLRALKWALAYGIRIEWLFLYGFPGEEDSWYAEMAEWIPKVSHLNNPSTVTPIQFHRFSPYHSRAEHYGLDLAPEVSYPLVYPLPEGELRDLAYYFDDKAFRARLLGEEVWAHRPGLAAAHDALLDWRTAWIKGGFRTTIDYPTVEYRVGDDGSWKIRDTRSCAIEEHHELDSTSTALMIACDGSVGEKRLHGAVTKALGREVGEAELAAAVAELSRRGLLLYLDGQYLGLAVSADRPELPSHFPGGVVVIRSYLRDRLLHRASTQGSARPFLDWATSPAPARARSRSAARRP
ncbi:MAG: RiPP maturation radical SAM C-methyltransferase [Holophagales bacterium]|nr:RiPP maturation radical SAM C-methyltransferase [Holophagales bacterium]